MLFLQKVPWVENLTWDSRICDRREVGTRCSDAMPSIKNLADDSSSWVSMQPWRGSPQILHAADTSSTAVADGGYYFSSKARLNEEGGDVYISGWHGCCSIGERAQCFSYSWSWTEELLWPLLWPWQHELYKTSSYFLTACPSSTTTQGRRLQQGLETTAQVSL